MYILLIIVMFVIAAMFVLSNQRAAAEPSVSSGVSQPAATVDQAFAYLSGGKLFVKKPGAEALQVHSEYIQQMLDKKEKNQRLHGWKEETSWGTSFASGGMRHEVQDAVPVKFTGTTFVPGDNKLIYFIADEHFGGLFEHDLESGSEVRLLHRQNLSFEDLHYDPKRDKILCTSRQNNGIANLVEMARDGSNYRELTAGDSCDSSPCWVNDHSVVYQSQGLARSSHGFIMAYGPASLELLNLETSEVEPVLEDPAYDLMQPRVCSEGDLYYVRRPYKAPTYGNRSLLTDILLFPFRVLRTFFHWLNFQSLMYTNKPLHGAGGPEMKIDAKELTLKGMRIDAERALQRERPVNGVPSLVPSSWELVRRTKRGEETVLARHVAAFTIGHDDSIVYTNGFGVFQLTPNGSATIAEEQVVEEVILT